MYIIYERQDTFLDFYPFSLSHPLWDIRAGVFTIKELWEKLLKEKVYVYTEREYMREYVEGLKIAELKRPQAGDIIICPHYFPTVELADMVKGLKEGEALVDKDTNIVAYKASYESKTYFEYFTKRTVDIRRISYLFEVIDIIKERIDYEFKLVNASNEPVIIDEKNVVIRDGKNIKFGKNVILHPFVVIDGADGKVFIDDNVEIMPFSYIKGPVYIGKNSIIKPHSKVYDGVSIGKVSKIAGEVKESIILGYSNKQHDGFLGHSFIGEWVNLGAMTTNSDLKNTYGSVKIRIKDREIDTKRTFLGLLMGDHSKSGIMTMFNTGTVVGFSSNIYGAGFQEKYIPSFSWGREDVYNLEKAVDTAKRMMARRKVDFTEYHKKLFEYIFELRLKEDL